MGQFYSQFKPKHFADSANQNEANAKSNDSLLQIDSGEFKTMKAIGNMEDTDNYASARDGQGSSPQ